MKSNLYILLTIITITGCTSKIVFEPVVPPPVVLASDLIISEVSTAINTDPTTAGTRNHYVEIYNGTSSTVNLADYAIGYFAVSDTSTLSNWSFNTGSFITFKRNLDTGKCYVIASPQCLPLYIKSDTTWGTASTSTANASIPLQLSGNSAIALLKKDPTASINLGGTNYKIIDVFGSPLVNRIAFQGTQSARNNILWTIAGENSDTRNRTFWRKKTVKDPSTDWSLTKGTTSLNSQWRISGDRAWDYSNIGVKPD